MSPTYHEESDTPEPKKPITFKKIVIATLWMVGIGVAVGVCVSLIYVYVNF